MYIYIFMGFWIWKSSPCKAFLQGWKIPLEALLGRLRSISVRALVASKAALLSLMTGAIFGKKY